MHSNIKQGRKMGRANLIRVGFHNFTIFEIHFCMVSHDIKHVIKTDITRFSWTVKMTLVSIVIELGM